MTYKVILANEARRSWRKIKGQDKHKISIALKALEDEPRLGAKMMGSYQDCYRLRVWPYRIVYRIRNRRLVVFVIAIGQREGVYK